MVTRVLVILGLIAATVGYALYQRQELASRLLPANQSASILTQVPAASFETLEGEKFSLAELYQDQSIKLLVVHFWGTWCAPCEAELPDLLTFIKRFSDDPGVRFLLVAVNDDKVKVQKHLKTVAIPKEARITWLLDNEQVYKEQFGTTRVPETFVFSSDKTTLRKYMGPQEWNKPMFFQTFDEFLQISSSRL